MVTAAKMMAMPNAMDSAAKMKRGAITRSNTLVGNNSSRVSPGVNNLSLSRRISSSPDGRKAARSRAVAPPMRYFRSGLRGPTMLARIGVMRALNRHVERVFNPDRKEKHWGRRKLARD